MNTSENDDNLDEGHDPQFLEWVMRYQDGALTAEELQELSNIICRDPVRRELFRRIQLRTAAIHDVLRVEAIQQSNELLNQDATDDDLWDDDSQHGKLTHRSSTLGQPVRPSSGRRRALLSLSAASLLLAFAIAAVYWNGQRANFVAEQAAPLEGEQVVLAEEVRATFFGKTSLSPGESLLPGQDYMLQSGLVMLKFPAGSTAIIEAPSIFRVEGKDQLVLNSGACSVYAPMSAERFAVRTPVTTVRDLGTRYYVNVHDNNETEVHMIEGAAELHSIASHVSGAVSRDTADAVQSRRSEEVVRLTNGEAVRVGGFVDYFGQRTEFNSNAYRRQLPDRLVDYQGTSTANGTVDDLQSIAVQRNGQIHQYSVDELIPIEVTYFRADPGADGNGNLCGFLDKPNRPGDWLEDRNLTTGIINFGGQPQPLATPITFDENSDAEVPAGLGIRFRQPVVNHAGPDVVLFEIQSFVNVLNGDPFHVYPVSDRTDLRPYTVTRFDLTLDSPSVREVAPLWSHRFPYAIDSLDKLTEQDAPIKVEVSSKHFFVIGVGIDLSDLGYAEGESVEELFFQHAADAKASKVDPVLIAGLPPLNSKVLHVTQLPLPTIAPQDQQQRSPGALPKIASVLSMPPVVRSAP